MSHSGNGWVWILAGLLALGCGDSGQTGSASCAQACACTNLAGFYLAKATVLAVEQRVVRVQIEQMLNELPGNAQYEQRELVGSFEPSTLCAPTQLELPEVGAEVFASFSIYNDADAGESRAWLVVQPWADDVRLGNGSSVSVADAVQLSDAGTCERRYGSPCNDTPSGSPSRDCSLSVPGARGAGPGASWSALLLCAWFVRRRRWAQTRREPDRRASNSTV